MSGNEPKQDVVLADGLRFRYQEDVDRLFPFPSYREKQRDTLEAAKRALEHGDIDNVILDAPTGVGKSAINTALCRWADSAFMTTPQKQLRNQLQNDEVLSDHYQALRGRRDYFCEASPNGNNCEDCYFNKSGKHNCSQISNCTYWDAKVMAMGAPTAVLTFSYLIVDGYLPTESEHGNQISFGNRDLGVIDEAHSLEGQVASLHAGFSVSPWSVPPSVFRTCASDLDPDRDTHHTAVLDIVEAIDERAERYIIEHQNYGEDNEDYQEVMDHVDRCENMRRKIDYMMEEIEEGRDWVVDVDTTGHPDYNRNITTFSLSPVKVDRFLQEHVWNRADKWVLSTATMPYRGWPSGWCNRLGLDADRTKVVHVGMPFPADQRPIWTGCEIAEMSGGGDEANWDEIMAALSDIAQYHEGENGLVHSASYSRARDLWETANSGEYPHLYNNVLLHERGRDAAEVVEEWQASDKQIVVTPSMQEGVDLVDEMCRWQALVKVPFPNVGDPRVDFLLNEENDWTWYFETTANSIVQSIGRAVRSKEDYADYYVLDESFEKVRERVDLPSWVEEAIRDGDGIGEAKDPLSF